MKQGTKFLYLALIIALSLFPSTKSLGASEQVLRLAIGFIPHIQFAPLYAGIEKGFYREEGIRLEIQYGLGIDIFSLLTTGRIDIGLSDSDQLIIAASKGAGLRAIFQYYQKYPVTIVARADRIRTPADFVGKTIGTPELFGTSWIGLQLFLEHFQLLGRVRIERIGFTQIPTLIADRVEGVVCFFNNEPIQLREAGVQIRQWDVRDFSSMVGASFITSTAHLATRRDLLTAFVRATERSIRFTVENQSEAFQLSLPYIGRPDARRAAFFQEVLRETSKLFKSNGEFGRMDPALYRESVSVLKRLGLIDTEVAVENLIHPLR